MERVRIFTMNIKKFNNKIKKIYGSNIRVAN